MIIMLTVFVNMRRIIIIIIVIILLGYNDALLCGFLYDDGYGGKTISSFVIDIDEELKR